MRTALLSLMLVLGTTAGWAVDRPLKNCTKVVECAQLLADTVDRLDRELDEAKAKIRALEKPKEPAAAAPGPVSPARNERATFAVPKTQRGTTVKVPESTIIDFCSDPYGCVVRLGMRDWDNTGRTSSRQFLFFYNKDNKNWRSEFGDWQGSNSNNVPQHAAQVGTCYFTDAEFQSNIPNDREADFGLLSGLDGNADCVLAIER